MDSEKKICFCPLYGIIDIIAKKWALLVIAVLGNEGSMGFNELQRQLTIISSKTLSQTLKDLQKAGLIKKEVISTFPLRVKYKLTKDGWEMRRLLIPLLKWASRRGEEKAPWCRIKVHQSV